MCGRSKLSCRKQLVEEYFDCPSDQPDWNPRYNIAPTQPIPVIRRHKDGKEFLKIASHSPFDEHILRRYFSLWDCAPGTQSGANQFGRLRGVVETTYIRRIARHSPFDWTGNRTGCHSAVTPPGPLFPDKRLIPCNLRKRRLLCHSDLYRGFESASLRHAV